MRDDYWASHLNGVFQVPDAGHTPAGCQPDGDQVDAPVWLNLMSDLTLSHIMLGCQLQTLRLAWRDRLFGAAVTLAAAGTHFHEYPGGTVARNQVYLTPTAPVIGRDDVITLGLKVGPGQPLPNLTDLVGDWST